MAKTKALISFAVTAKLICVFVFAYAKSRFSHDAAHVVSVRGDFLFLLILRIGGVILLWHSQGLPYSYFESSLWANVTL